MSHLAELVTAAGPEKATAAISAFDTEYSAYKRRWRLFFILGAVLFIAALIGAAFIADFSIGRVIAGFPQMAEFLARALPDLQWSKLGADKLTEGSLAYWFYAFPKWLGLLWESIEMAILATALGGGAAFL